MIVDALPGRGEAFHVQRMILSASFNDAWLPTSGEGGAHIYQEGERLERLPPSWYPVLKSLGIQLLQIDSEFLMDGKSPGQLIDWKLLDDRIRECIRNGFEVAYFPRWHWPPQWMVRSRKFVPLRCAEHNKPNGCFSHWSPHLLPWYEHCSRELSRRSRTTDSTLSAIYMGVHGDFGEAIYPQKMSELSPSGLRDHQHDGFWCADRFARRSFVEFLKSRYPSLAALNSAWGTRYHRWTEARCPASSVCDSHRRWLDFVQWYHDSMTRYAASVARLTRSIFPHATLMLPLGGGVEPLTNGQDNSALPKAMKPFGVHVRSTAGGMTHLLHPPAESFCRNYPVLKRIATACKLYGSPFWLESPYPPKMKKEYVLGRIFEAISCGAKGYFDWSHNWLGARDVYEQYKDIFVVRKPVVDVAVLFPLTHHRLATSSVYPSRYWEACSRLRRISDYDVLDENLIRDGALDHYEILVMLEGNVIERAALRTIVRWLRKGGILLHYNLGAITTVEGDASFHRLLTGLTERSRRHPPAQQRLTYDDQGLLRHVRQYRQPFTPDSCSHLKRDAHALVATDLGAVVWERRIGRGHSINFAGGWDQRTFYYELVRDVIHHFRRPRTTRVVTCPVGDDWEDLFVTRFTDGIGIFNLTARKRKCLLCASTVTVDPFSIKIIPNAQSNPSAIPLPIPPIDCRPA